MTPKSEILDNLIATIVENTTGDVTATDILTVFQQIIDSYLHQEDSINHNDLANLNLGDYKHLTAIQLTALETIISTYADKIDSTDAQALADTAESNSNAYADSVSSNAENNAKSYADTLVVGLLDDRGNYDASVDLFPSLGGSGTAGAIKKGDLWTVSVSGTLGGVDVSIGDAIRALSDTPGQTSANWNITENNLGYVPENSLNKKTDIEANKTSNTFFAPIKAIYDWAVGLFQPMLVSGTNIKTLNGNSILGSGNFDTSVPQANKIYVDSINGVDSTGRGRIDNPYLTVEYALSDNTNTGTVTAITTNNSETLTSVSSTSNIKVGQVISGAGIPPNTTVISFTSNTIVLSKKCTTSATITATWITQYLLICNGSFIWVSNWNKEGFNFDFGNSNIYFSGTIYTVTNRVSSLYIIGGNWSGNNTSSKLIYGTSQPNINIIFRPINYYSIGTGIQVELSSINILYFDCPNFDARFGTICSVVSSFMYWNGYKYGLLGGLTLNNTSTLIDGITETPASVLAINSTSGSNLTVNGTVYGSVDTRGMTSRVTFNSGVIGTTIGCGTNLYDAHIFQSVYRQTITVAGNTIINFAELCTINQSNGRLVVNTGNVSYNGSAGTYTLNGFHRSDFQNDITTSGTCEVYLNNNCGYGNCSIGSGTTFQINGKYRCQFTSHAGTVTVSKGAILQADRITGTNYRITGTLNIYGEIQLLRSYGSEVNESVTPTLPLSTGVILIDSGILKCSLSTSKSGLITKYGTGGTLILKGQPYLKVSNGLAPLYIKSNTGTSQDVYNFGIVGNGATGFRIADTFSDATYGTAYAPNLIGTATNNENSNYNF